MKKLLCAFLVLCVGGAAAWGNLEEEQSGFTTCNIVAVGSGTTAAVLTLGLMQRLPTLRWMRVLVSAITGLGTLKAVDRFACQPDASAAEAVGDNVLAKVLRMELPEGLEPAIVAFQDSRIEDVTYASCLIEIVPHEEAEEILQDSDVSYTFKTHSIPFIRIIANTCQGVKIGEEEVKMKIEKDIAEPDTTE